ncbi:hypothetical protein Taro_048283 [Colocasia esculenta]|uniref:Uncharacterized protein n=1 Tax=Colocasia esculenta TaxID=4460 RepID=A0A843X515_COLES|nr:hypothetical protein [Colocasia esculenta]
MALVVVFMLPLFGGLRLHGCRVSRAGHSGQTELWEALLGQEELLRSSLGRFSVLAWISARSHLEDVVWSRGDVVPCPIFPFFAEVEVCPGVRTVVVVVGERRLTGCGLTLMVFPVVGTVESSWAQSAHMSCICERDKGLRCVLNATALVVAFMLSLFGGLRLHGCRVSHAGQSADVGLAKATVTYVAFRSQ